MHNLFVASSKIGTCQHVSQAAPAAATPVTNGPPSIAQQPVRATRALRGSPWPNVSGRRSPSRGPTTAGYGPELERRQATASSTPGETSTERASSIRPIGSRGRWPTIALSRRASTSCIPVTTRRASTPDICGLALIRRTSETGPNVNAARNSVSAARRATTPGSPRSRYDRSSSGCSAFRVAARHRSQPNSGSASRKSAASCVERTGLTSGINGQSHSRRTSPKDE